MSEKIHNQSIGGKQRDPDLVNAEIALKRAAVKAREIANKAGTTIVIFKNGGIREVEGDSRVHPD